MKGCCCVFHTRRVPVLPTLYNPSWHLTAHKSVQRESRRYPAVAYLLLGRAPMFNTRVNRIATNRFFSTKAGVGRLMRLDHVYRLQSGRHDARSPLRFPPLYLPLMMSTDALSRNMTA